MTVTPINPPPERRYVRVVLAYDPKDEELMHARLDEYIEGDLDTDTDDWNGVQGAYVSTAYDDRETALHGPWKADPTPSRPEDREFYDGLADSIPSDVPDTAWDSDGASRGAGE